MRFAYDFTSPAVLLVVAMCAVVVAGFATVLVLASYARVRAEKRFGDPKLVARLATFDATAPRATKGVLLVLALLCAFAALARPQFGRGKRLVPATNLDVVVVLDYSKSMYARDVLPSRIARAKAEVATLVRGLPGARFGAVAFAGEPMSFPLTSDGAAVAQFFRQLEPNDMPVGGTATARALEAARELLARDQKAKDHVRVIVLVTDGEDLEGDPVSVAQHCAEEGTRIDVVQIGGRSPEVIPDVGPDGKVTGIRRDQDGKPLTTSLSAEGEAQLARVATTTQGMIVRSEGGQTGIDTIARELGRLVREELAEKVETVWAEEYAWFLGAAVVLLVVEAAIGENARWARRAKKKAKKGKKKAAKARAVATAAAACLLALALVACGWDPSRPFEREAPAVKTAVRELGDGGEAGAAATVLEDYLSTGPCAEGNIGAPDSLHKLPNGTFDLGLALFRIGETYGRRFGDEEETSGPQGARPEGEDPTRELRRAEVDCALRIVRAIAEDESVPLETRSRARYLEGNLLFLDQRYEDAVHAYDRSLTLAPAALDAGDPVARDAAWNRSIALRRIEDKKDAGEDASEDASHDASQDAAHDAASEGGGGQDAGHDSGGDSGSSGDDAGPSEPPDAGSPPPPEARANEEERILDQLENAPTVQEEQAKKKAQKRRVVQGMMDK